MATAAETERRTAAALADPNGGTEWSVPRARITHRNLGAVVEAAARALSSAMGWVIEAWSRELGTGTVASSRAAPLQFDAAAALVDDFVIGESVEVELARDGDDYRVLLIWPDDPRFAWSTDGVEVAPALHPDAAARANTVLEIMPQGLDWRWVGRGSDLVLQGDNDGFSLGVGCELLCRDVVYLEGPMRWSGKSLRLAGNTERSYVATRCELDERTIVLRIVDDERRIFFVACKSLGDNSLASNPRPSM